MIANPQLKGYPPNIPADLEPNKKWTGIVRRRQDYIADLHTGNFYVAVHATHRDKPYYKRIPKLKPKLKDGPAI